MKQLPANTVIQVSSPATDNNLRINFGCWFGGCIYNADGSIGSKARASFPFPGYRDYSLILRAGGQVVQGGTNVSFVTTNQTPSDLEFCLNDDSLSDNHGQWFIKLVVDESQAVSKPREAVTCNVSGLEPGGASRQSEAFYIADANSVCIPDGSAKGQCLPYFGGCGTASSVGDVSFRVFDDGGTNKSEPSGYLSFSTLNAACSTRSPYACRRWFGMASTSDGRKVQCYLFNDGMSNLVGPTDAIYYRGSGQVCMPDGSATGLCRKWFGNCEVTN
jgi:hypothetical protein